MIYVFYNGNDNNIFGQTGLAEDYEPRTVLGQWFESQALQADNLVVGKTEFLVCKRLYVSSNFEKKGNLIRFGMLGTANAGSLI